MAISLAKQRAANFCRSTFNVEAIASYWIRALPRSCKGITLVQHGDCGFPSLFWADNELRDILGYFVSYVMSLYLHFFLSTFYTSPSSLRFVRIDHFFRCLAHNPDGLRSFLLLCHFKIKHRSTVKPLFPFATSIMASWELVTERILHSTVRR